MNRSFPFLLSLAATLLPAALHAHLMPAQHGTVRLSGNAAFLVLSVPVSALHGFDDDGDGMLSPAELQAHQAALSAEIGQRLFLGDGAARGDTVTRTLVYTALSDEVTHHGDQLVVLEHLTFPAEPLRPTLRTDLFGSGVGEQRFDLRVTRGAEVENVELTARANERRLLGPRAPWGGAVGLGIPALGALLLCTAALRRGRRPA